MKPLIFNFPSEETLAQSLVKKNSAEKGLWNHRLFPDGESYLQILSELQNREVILLCSLNQPDSKLLPLIFFSEAARELGASKITLVAPYLAYMRQDKRFQKGEALTSDYFAKIISKYFEELITIDPHLHRRKSLDEIYAIPSKVLHAAPLLSEWILENVKNPVLIGPDEESEQWVSEVAGRANAAFTVLRKSRHGDRDVEVSIPDLENYKDCVPVLVDDIISSGKTMIAAVQHLRKQTSLPVICMGVHAIFGGTAYKDLMASGVGQVVTCNSIQHESNGISVEKLISDALKLNSK